MTKAETLRSIIGQYVRVSNLAYMEHLPDTHKLHVHGSLHSYNHLTRPGDNDEFFVEIKKCDYGTSGLAFTAQSVESIDQQPSGTWVILLR